MSTSFWSGDGHLALMRTLHGASPPAEFGEVVAGDPSHLGDKLSSLRFL